MRILPFLFLLAMAQQASKQAPPAVTQEIKRLESCRPVFKLSPAPVNLRVVWTQPFDIVWAQEESHNMGGWSFVEPRLRELGYDVRYVGRDASASPASGSRQIHLREQKELVRAAFQAKGSHYVSSYNPRDFFSNLPRTEEISQVAEKK